MTALLIAPGVVCSYFIAALALYMLVGQRTEAEQVKGQGLVDPSHNRGSTEYDQSTD